MGFHLRGLAEAERVLISEEVAGFAGHINDDHMKVSLIRDAAEDFGRLWIQQIQYLLVERKRPSVDNVL